MMSLPMTTPSVGERTAWFSVLVSGSLATFWASVTALIRLTFQEEQYSHILLIPPVSIVLLFSERKRILSHVETCWGVGAGLLVAGALFGWYTLGHSVSSQNDQLAIAMFSLIVIWIGAFVLCYGASALRAGLFPVLFLFLIVPIPSVVLDTVVSWLQAGSAEASNAAFELLGVPVQRNGTVFSLPGVTIEVAKECSGIRSSLVLLIVSLLAGHLYLRSAWTKTLFSVAIFPLAIVKNGIRIVTLTLLSIYVDPRFLTGQLHRQGGIVFFLLALIMLAPVLWLLQRSERVGPERSRSQSSRSTHHVDSGR